MGSQVPHSGLTAEERRVIAVVAKGHPLEQAAQTTGLLPETFKVRLRSALQKLAFAESTDNQFPPHSGPQQFPRH
jgi:DNA-binding NarL/FixJ family response regulator